VAITNLAELTTAIVSWDHREGDDDFAAEISNFIALTESVFQIRLKLLQFESTATITVTDGVGSLPADYVGMRSIYWNGDYTQELRYITPAEFDARRNADYGEQYFYTISGSTIRFLGVADGEATATYNAKFAPLTALLPTNAILTNYPDAYLWGGLMHGAMWSQDEAMEKKWGNLFGGVIDRINQDNQDRKYAGPLTVRSL